MNPILHLALDKLYDGKVIDDQGQQYTVAGQPNTIPDPVFGQVLDFDGQETAITIPDEERLRIGHYTVEVWIKPKEQSDYPWKGIIGKPGRNYHIWLHDTAFIHHRFKNSTGWDQGAPGTAGDSIQWNEWNHIAITNDGNKAKTYINAKLEAEGPAGGDPIIDNTSLIIGRNLDSDQPDARAFFKGQITQVRIYNQALSAEAIQQDKLADEQRLLSFREIHPIDFDLYDKDSQNVLYIEDVSDQLLTLQIRNAASQQIQLNDLTATTVSNSSYHFALRFRPGTLSAASLSGPDKIQLTAITSENWEMAPPEQDSSGMDVIYLKSKSAGFTLDPDALQTLVFKNVGADAGQGARGTRVELLCTNMSYTDGGSAITTNREIHLGVINHRGKKDLPLHIGFVGDNAILNDGATANALKIRMTNTAVYDATNPDVSQLTFEYDADDTKRSKIILSFDSGDVADEWALGTETEIKTIVITQPTGWSVIVPQEGKTPEWILHPTNTTRVLPGKNAPVGGDVNHFDIDINNIITNFPTGHTPLYVRYENIPGYWDGQMALIIEKRPLVFHDKKVGIGVTSPEASLQVSGDLMLTENNARLRLMRPAGPNYIDFKKDEKLHFRHLGQDNSNPAIRMTIAADGKVGIGAELEVNGTVTADNYALNPNGNGPVPAGGIIMWSGAIADIPVGWALCNGTNGSPDLRNQFIVGAGDTYSYGNTGGADTVTLTTNQMPGHNHSMSLSSASAGSHSHRIPNYYKGDGGGVGNHFDMTDHQDDEEGGELVTNSTGSHTHTITGSTDNTGNSEAHENRPPYFALCFIMKLP
ncbi:MAG: LamG-like jellyroll fold domain-containing protein [Pseudomonadales bacterium]